jgi:DNA-binding NarL/FixJ family response regulator
MKMNFEDYVASLESKASHSEILGALTDYFGSHGYQRIIWLYLPPESLFDFSRVELVYSGYDDFPDVVSVMKQGINSRKNVDRDELRSHEALKPHTRGDEPYVGVFADISKGILKALETYNLSPGIRISAYGSKQRDSIFDVAKDINPETPQINLSHRQIELTCQAAHQRLCEIRALERLTEYKLTPRELGVLRGVIRGLSDSEIARVMDISPYTVGSYNRSIYLKLKVKDRTNAAVKALDLGLT